MHALLRVIYFLILFSIALAIVGPFWYFVSPKLHLGFPTVIASTRSNSAEMSVPYSGWFHILFFMDGAFDSSGLGTRPVTNVKVIKNSGSEDELPVRPISYFFRQAMGGYVVSGRAYCKVYARSGDRIRISIEPDLAGYDGIIVRTGFTPMFVSIALYICICAGVSSIAFWFTQRKVLRMLKLDREQWGHV